MPCGDAASRDADAAKPLASLEAATGTALMTSILGLADGLAHIFLRSPDLDVPLDQHRDRHHRAYPERNHYVAALRKQPNRVD